MDYEVSLKKSREGFAVWVPGLPGCCSQGETKNKALKNIKIAIAEYLAVARALATSARPIQETFMIGKPEVA